MWINPCHPLLSIETIKKAVIEFQKFNYNSYTSVIKTQDWIFNDEGYAVTNKSPKILENITEKIINILVEKFIGFSKTIMLK